MTSVRLRILAWIMGVLLLAGIAILAADWGYAARQAPLDDQLVKALQLKVREDATVSQQLDGEQKRITEARQARRTRGRAVGWGMVACAAIFLASIRRIIALTEPRPVEMTKIAEESKSVNANRKKKCKNRHVSPAPPAGPEIDLSIVDQAVAQHGCGKEAAIPLLQELQRHYRYLPEEALHRLCEITQITPAEIEGTSSFYSQFRRSPVGRHIVRICHGTACHVAGARQVSEELRRYLKMPEGADTDADRRFTLEEVACLGCCSLAPVLMVDEHTVGRLKASDAANALQEVEETESA